MMQVRDNGLCDGAVVTLERRGYAQHMSELTDRLAVGVRKGEA